MSKTYEKTKKLEEAKYRGQKALVVEALQAFSSPQPVEEIEKKANENGRYTKMLNEWARENGGVHGSVLYHLRELVKLGMVKEEGAADAGPKAVKKGPAKKATPKKGPKKPTPQPMEPGGGEDAEAIAS